MGMSIIAHRCYLKKQAYGFMLNPKKECVPATLRCEHAHTAAFGDTIPAKNRRSRIYPTYTTALVLEETEYLLSAVRSHILRDL